MGRLVDAIRHSRLYVSLVRMIFYFALSLVAYRGRMADEWR